MKRFISFMVLVLCSLLVSAENYDFYKNGIYYIITSEVNKTVAVTYSESQYVKISYSVWENYSYAGDVVIPETVNYNNTIYRVTSICNGAFSDCVNLKSVRMGNSVTTIESYAFAYSKLTNVTLSNCVTSIDEGAFEGCSGLISVNIPNSLTSIGYKAFYGCNNLTSSVTIPSSLESISGYAFYNCSSLKSLSISEGVKSIGDYAFSYCTSLKQVTIPNSVTTISGHAFWNCNGLNSVTIGNSIKTIGKSAFFCYNMTSVIMQNPTPPYLVEEKESIFDHNTESFYYFYSPSTTTLYVPMGSGNAYRSASYWRFFSVIIEGDNLSDIQFTLTYKVDNEVYKTYKFKEGEKITPLAEPTKAGYKFSGWSEIPSTMPAHNVTVNGYFTSIYPHSFEVNGLLYLLNEPDLTTVKVVGVNENVIDVVIPQTINYYGYTYRVTAIGEKAFRDANITSVSIPNSITTIESGAFSGASNIISLTVPNGIKTIENSTFLNCNNLKTVILPDGLTSIGSHAFSGCPCLESVNIPQSVTHISEYVFDGSTRVTLHIDSPNPFVLKEPIKAERLHVPRGSTLSYANAKYWNEADIIYAEDGNTRYYPVLPISSNDYALYSNIQGNGEELSEHDYVEVNCYDSDYLSKNLILKGTCEVSDYFVNGTYRYKPTPTYKENIISTYSYPASIFNVSTSGTLVDLVGIDNLNSIQNLIVKGNLNGTDILAIRKMKSLKLLDLSDAHIVEGGLSYYENYSTSKNTIGEYFYEGLNEILRIKLPKDIEKIQLDAFKGCSSLITLRIPSSIKEMGLFIPLKCLQIEDIGNWCKAKISKDIDPYHSYYNLEKHHLYIKDQEVFNLEIPSGATNIPRFSFFGCYLIESVSLPSTVKDIGYFSFGHCRNILSVTSLNTIPPQIEYQPFSNTKGAFVDNVERGATLYVPKGCRGIYWLHPLWENFTNIVETDATDINSVVKNKGYGSNSIYNLRGVKMSDNANDINNLPKGVYIISGKKVIYR